MILRSLTRYRDYGLLILRVGVGVSFVVLHGYGKISGGPKMWEQVGGGMGVIGITFLPVFWGFMAAFAEFVGGLLFALGLMFRPACMLLAFTMLIAALFHITSKDPAIGGWAMASHAIECFIVFASFILIGPGRYSIDKE